LEKVIISAGGKPETINITGFFVNIGYTPATAFIKDLIKINDKGEMVIDSENKTNIRGIFAAGNCTSYPFKQVITSGAQGAAAALSANKYLLQQF